MEQLRWFRKLNEESLAEERNLAKKLEKHQAALLPEKRQEKRLQLDDRRHPEFAMQQPMFLPDNPLEDYPHTASAAINLPKQPSMDSMSGGSSGFDSIIQAASQAVLLLPVSVPGGGNSTNPPLPGPASRSSSFEATVMGASGDVPPPVAGTVPASGLIHNTAHPTVKKTNSFGLIDEAGSDVIAEACALIERSESNDRLNAADRDRRANEQLFIDPHQHFISYQGAQMLKQQGGSTTVAGIGGVPPMGTIPEDSIIHGPYSKQMYRSDGVDGSGSDGCAVDVIESKDKNLEGAPKSFSNDTPQPSQSQDSASTAVRSEERTSTDRADCFVFPDSNTNAVMKRPNDGESLNHAKRVALPTAAMEKFEIEDRHATTNADIPDVGGRTTDGLSSQSGCQVDKSVLSIPTAGHHHGEGKAIQTYDSLGSTLDSGSRSLFVDPAHSVDDAKASQVQGIQTIVGASCAMTLPQDMHSARIRSCSATCSAKENDAITALLGLYSP